LWHSLRPKSNTGSKGHPSTNADAPEEPTCDSSLDQSLDIAFALLRHERALMAAHLVERIAKVSQAPPTYTYGDFIDAAEQDPRFQVSLGQLVALAEEPDPWSVLLERVEEEETHMNGTDGS